VILTLIEIVFILLRLATATSSRVELVTKTTEEATSAATVVATAFLVLLAGLLLLVLVAAGERGDRIVQLIHCGVLGRG
jgi:hypothetical protein